MMDESINRFLDYLALERGLSRNTLLAYGHDMEEFAEFLAGRGVRNGRGGTRRPSILARRGRFRRVSGARSLEISACNADGGVL